MSLTSDAAIPQFATELAAINAVCSALEPLDDAARARVLTYATAVFEIDLDLGKASATPALPPATGTASIKLDDVQLHATAVVSGPTVAASPKFNSFAELYDAVQPGSQAEKALAAGYWLQVSCEGDSFDAQSANNLLKNLGHGVGNITKAIDYLKIQTPALALQIKKGGTSRQARKLYKVTVAGIRAIEEMIGRNGQ